jgi:hypothetical protein
MLPQISPKKSPFFARSPYQFKDSDLKSLPSGIITR